MHADEVVAEPPLVARLVSAQFPEWSSLRLSRLESSGTDNVMYRLGGELAVRLPRLPSAALQVEKEQRWLPHLAGALPLEIPSPVAGGEPGFGYPWRWSVYRWIPGVEATVQPPHDLTLAAHDLGRFVAALHAIDPAGGPSPGPHNSFRGEPLVRRDSATREAIAELAGVIDADTAASAWEAALAAPTRENGPVWVHGDLTPANLLIQDDALSAVIDFGCLGVGDPAADAPAAWSVFTAATRGAFRAAARFDDATWARGRGWALSFGLIALPYYVHSNPGLAGIARRTIDEVLADSAGAG
jgi:aminoglycoside phosphotransferase (APT) family kinase protein